MAMDRAFEEAGAEARYVQVDTRTKRLADGSDFRPINEMGQVPVLRTTSSTATDPAILQYGGSPSGQ